MPTTNKRINLTIPEPVYDRILSYKQKNGVASDAAACLQLIIRQLDGLENTEKMLKMVSKFSMDELQQISTVGFKVIKEYTNPGEENEETE